MREGDDLFFAPGMPGIRFNEVDLADPRLADQYRQRIEGYYLGPARACIQRREAFAAGLILVSVIDLLARLHLSATELEQSGQVGSSFRKFVLQELTSLGTEELAKRFYDEFRNGLSHEARIKSAGEFSLEQQGVAYVPDGRLRINPAALLKEVEAALDKAIDQIKGDQKRRAAFAERLREHFATEFGILQEVRRAE